MCLCSTHTLVVIQVMSVLDRPLVHDIKFRGLGKDVNDWMKEMDGL